MFATDYPFESAQESAEFIEQTPLADDARADICFNNAAKLLGLAKV
jgi:predicted TIM-barrel fold metal-dependent hydrolase